MPTFLSIIGQLIDLINMLWEFSPIAFILFVICAPIILVFAYAAIHESFVNPNYYPKEYLETMKSKSNK